MKRGREVSPKAAKRKASPEPVSLPPNLYVLVVDDDEAQRDGLTALLKGVGVAVRAAENGEQALKLLDAVKDPPAAIITDLSMPKMGGAEFVRAVRQRNSMRRVPIAVVSGSSNDEAPPETALFIGKPLRGEIFIHTLMALMRRNSA